MVTARDLGMRSHSYRNFSPGEFLDALEESERRDVLSALERVESGRFEPFLANGSKFFDKLDEDEQRLFARRNPEYVFWLTVWNQLNGYNPWRRWREFARQRLDDDGAIDPPTFARKQVREGRSLLQDLAFRRRSYRNWSPYTFMDVIGDDHTEHELGKGMVRELDLYTPEIREKIEDYPVEEEGQLVARAILERIEAGRFEPMLSKGFYFFGALDPDERRMFGRRNPGLVMWISAYGESNHLLHREELFPFTEGFFPTLGEGGEATVAAIRQQMEDRL